MSLKFSSTTSFTEAAKETAKTRPLLAHGCMNIAGLGGVSTSSSDQDTRPGPRRKPRENASSRQVDSSQGSPRLGQGPHRRQNPPKQRDSSERQTERLAQTPTTPRPTKSKGGPAPSSDAQSHPGPSRRARFQGKLTVEATDSGSGETKDAQTTSESTLRPSERYRSQLPQGEDLTSSLIRSLSTPPYPDCPICFASIRPAQPIWSCSPSTPVVSLEGQVHYCWTSFHTKCIKAWAAKSVKEIAEAWRARGEHDKLGDWRCPGCQAKREIIPSGYWCFCHAVPEPKLTRLSTPHSCGKPCSRVRDSGCGHPCNLLCHPGPCPPCQVVTQLECYCPRHTSLSFRCGMDIDGKEKGKRDLSCGNDCGRLLKCGKHACNDICHEGECKKCPLTEVVKCWCGKEDKEVLCGEGTPKECFVEGEVPWTGRYGCDKTCQRPFDCGIHQCEKTCHPPSSKPEICPRSPSKITTCPCGRSSIAPPNTADPSCYAFPARANCQSRIPTCSSQCLKPHPQCSHPCEAKCHSGSCPPCDVTITRPCRCGATTRRIICHEMYSASEGGGFDEKEVICDRTCTVLRACGHHQCRRICCPLASLAATNKKGKKRATQQNEVGIGEERGGLHECDLVCGKMLSCGNHRCEERDHRLPCPPCLRSSFEEMFCPCRRTVLEPPVPCGTRIHCNYPCPRPSPSCGHPSTPHSCHDDSLPCPPCPHLANKQCACGKKEMSNVKCSLEQDKVFCGSVCGKLMSCGFHHCESYCHSGDCGTCTAPCGKSRKLCLPNQHPCTRPCHAPAACPESEPCEATISVVCPCGRIKQAVQCGRHNAHPSGHQVAPPKCNSECSIAKRNARLAEALGINTDSKDKDKVTYNYDVVAFARANSRFVPTVEKAFAEFVASDKRIKVLPHMPAEKRKFVHDLASVYRIDTQFIDQEPQRSVQLIRRIDTRIPMPVLSMYLASLAPPSNFGRLADLRVIKGSSSPSPSPSWPFTSLSKQSTNATPSSSSSATGTRGWAPAAGMATLKPPKAVAASSVSPFAADAAPTTLAVSSGVPISRVRSRTNAESVDNEEEERPITDDWEDDL